MLTRYVIEHYGDIASVVGLLISLIGFVITLWNLRKTRRAAEEARQAAREAVQRTGAHLLTHEVGTSLQLVREIDVACRERNWTNATHRCGEARIRLAPRLADSGLDSEEREVIHRAIDDIWIILNELQRIQQAPNPRDLATRSAKRLHELITALGRIKGRLQSQALEV